MEKGWISYPWHALEKVPRSAMRAIREAFASLQDPHITRDIAAAASSMLGPNERVEITASNVRFSNPSQPAFEAGTLCLLGNQQKSLVTLVEVEPELAHRIVSTLLSRPPLWVDRTQPTPSALHAAIGAFIIASVRKTSPDHGLHLVAVGPSARSHFPTPSPCPRLNLTVAFADASYGACLWWRASATPTHEPRPFDTLQLDTLGQVPLRLELVAALATATRDELASLELGDAWLPLDGWLAHREENAVLGDVCLAAPHAGVGWCGVLRPNGEIVLGHGTMQTRETQDRSQPSSPTTSAEQVAQALADVPVVVRVEVGSVTLSAREWAALQPGDVLTTGCRIAERATLRIGGIEVARGELVDVEGELGVRIEEIVAPKEGGR